MAPSTPPPTPPLTPSTTASSTSLEAPDTPRPQGFQWTCLKLITNFLHTIFRVASPTMEDTWMEVKVVEKTAGMQRIDEHIARTTMKGPLYSLSGHELWLLAGECSRTQKYAIDILQAHGAASTKHLSDPFAAGSSWNGDAADLAYQLRMFSRLRSEPPPLLPLDDALFPPLDEAHLSPTRSASHQSRRSGALDSKIPAAPTGTDAFRA